MKTTQKNQVKKCEQDSFHWPPCLELYTSTAKKKVQKYVARYQKKTQFCMPHPQQMMPRQLPIYPTFTHLHYWSSHSPRQVRHDAIRVIFWIVMRQPVGQPVHRSTYDPCIKHTHTHMYWTVGCYVSSSVAIHKCYYTLGGNRTLQETHTIKRLGSKLKNNFIFLFFYPLCTCPVYCLTTWMSAIMTTTKLFMIPSLKQVLSNKVPHVTGRKSSLLFTNFSYISAPVPRTKWCKSMLR